ncbi:MAG: hypothetical protein HY514_02140 [Candidatus Aenigmarchaeota archaeon]|nr:hypothetical protein [Candidatus Aenigmarchaeota archaeon]
MKRVILDTNIYGFLLEKDEPDTIEDSVAKSDIVIYGVRVIRKELRNTPKKSTAYDRSRKAIRNLRISLLTLYNTITKMLSKQAVKSYRLVNTLRKYRTPEFIGYAEFRRLLP